MKQMILYPDFELAWIKSWTFFETFSVSASKSTVLVPYLSGMSKKFLE